MPVGRVKALGYIVAALGAVVGGIFLAAQVGVGSNDVGLGLALPAFAACFLGGAVLTGGRGTFVGAALGAVFLTVISNATQVLTRAVRVDPDHLRRHPVWWRSRSTRSRPGAAQASR